jgi:hypothetical protein
MISIIYNDISKFNSRTRQPRNDQKIAKETMAEDVGNSMTAIQD